MAKKKSLVEKLQGMPQTTRRVWDRLTAEQQEEIDEMLRVYIEMPPKERRSQRQVAQLISDHVGMLVRQATVHEWLVTRGWRG